MTLLSKKTILTTLTLIILSVIGSSIALAEDGVGASALISGAESFFKAIVHQLSAVLFYPIFGIPFLVGWLIAGGIFFTLWLGFINFRLFGHALAVVRGKYSKDSDPGEVTHFQALAAAVSATVGLGNIAGVAIAVSIGGPGAVVWMSIAGLLGMSTKFVEVSWGQKFRKISKEGKVSGGAFFYLKEGLEQKGLPKLGKALAAIFAVFCIGSSLGGGNMFQANQAVSILRDTFDTLNDYDLMIALVLAVSVGLVLIGGIRRIASVAEAIVPLMAVIYLTACAAVLVVNVDALGGAIGLMFSSAFSSGAATGGIIGAIIAGVQRSAFSNEAGIGSAPIAHAAAKTKEPVREGCVALLEPFIDTVVICFMTGLVITVSGAYMDTSIEGDMKGVLLTSAAFATVAEWFPIVLSISIVLFAYSTMITWSYYGERCWDYLFGSKTIPLYHVIFCAATFFGGIISLNVVIELSDLMLLSMALPNLLGLYIMSGDIKKDVRAYESKLKAGKFKRVS
jgi:AGCS family alanine or glycine:cation symporter